MNSRRRSAPRRPPFRAARFSWKLAERRLGLWLTGRWQTQKLCPSRKWTLQARRGTGRNAMDGNPPPLPLRRSSSLFQRRQPKFLCSPSGQHLHHGLDVTTEHIGLGQQPMAHDHGARFQVPGPGGSLRGGSSIIVSSKSRELRPTSRSLSSTISFSTCVTPVGFTRGLKMGILVDPVGGPSQRRAKMCLQDALECR